MNNSEFRDLDSELTDRLEGLFDGEDAQAPDSLPAPTEGDVLHELKAIVMEIDWEINDENMSRLIDHTEKLKSQFESDKYFVLFLHLLGSVGKYIRKRKANSHPSSVKLLYSVFTGLERVYHTNLADGEKKHLLLKEVTRFKKLKDQVTEKKKQTVAAAAVQTGPDSLPDVSGWSPNEILAFAIEEIRRVVREEFKALKAELKL